jgi:hypothetical protein
MVIDGPDVYNEDAAGDNGDGSGWADVPAVNRDSTVIYIQIGESDMNNIKDREHVASFAASTLLSFTSALLTDMTTNNNVVAVESGLPLLYTADDIDPELDSWDLDMTNSWITLHFDETMRASTAIDSTIMLQNAASDAPPLAYTLTNYGVQDDNNKMVRLTLSRTDMDEIKRLEHICTTLDDCFIKLVPSSISDMSDNTVKSVVQNVDDFAEDVTPPKLFQFTLDLHNNQLTLEFSETVDAGSFDVSQIQLHSKADISAGEIVQLSSDSVIDGLDSHTLVVDLSRGDLNAIKLATKLAVRSKNSVYMTAPSAMIKDMNAVPLVDVTAQKAFALFEDATVPELTGFEFNMDTRTVTLTFTETVNITTLDPSMFVLQGAATSTGDWGEHAISHDAEVSLVNGPIVSFIFSDDDANMIKIRTSMCTEQADTFLRMEQGAVRDMVGNLVNAVDDGDAKQCGGHTKDGTRPKLLSFDAEMPTGKPPIMLTLTFDETVVLAELDVSGIVIEDGNGRGYELTKATATQDVTIPTVIEVTVSTDDLEGLRAMKTVGRDAHETYITLSASAMVDHNDNEVEPTADGVPLQVTTHTVDITPPEVVEFDLDLDKNELRLTFSEHVELETIDPKTIKIQEADSCESEQAPP